MSEELASKISENARLHATLDEIDKKYEGKISNLVSKIQSLEHQLSKSAQKDRVEDTKQKELIHGLKFDNAELVSKIGDLEKELIDSKDKITVLKVQLESSNPENFSPSNPIPTQKMTISRSSNALPLNTTEARIQTVEVLSTLGESVQNFVASMSDVHTYWEHRIKDLKSGMKLSDQSSQLSNLLLQNVKFLRPIEQSFQTVLSNVLSDPKGKFGFLLVQDFQGFCDDLKTYVNYSVKEIEPLIVSCLQQESNSSACPPTQQAKNGQLISAIKKYGKTLENFCQHLEQLVHSMDSNEALENIENLTVSISQLNQNAAELSHVYNAKAKDEAKLPTCSEALKDTNTCIMSALSSLSQGTSLLSHHISDNLPKIGILLTSELTVEEISKSPEPVKEDIEEEVIEEPFENTEEKIKQCELMIETLNDKLKKSEQNREHWRLECQLLQLKLCQDESEISSVDEIIKGKIDELVAAKLLADSKATHFYLECASLQKRLEFWEKAKKKALNQVQEAELYINEIKEEAKTTSTNYEDQLSMMSEHLANMNEKLTQQTDEIERLKYELANKKVKK